MPVNIAMSEVPLLDLNAQYYSIKDEIKAAIDEVLESQYFIMGPEVKDFEEKMAEYCQSKYAISCASGSDALLLALMALDIGPGDAVITSPFTFFATAGAIARLGATPIFVDIDPDTYNIDAEQIELFLEGNHSLNKKLSIYADSVKAIIPVHLYGQMADMDSIMSISSTYDIPVIEDAAQSIGSKYKGKCAGNIGDFGCFSFFPSKNLGGYGDGGLVTTNNSNWAEKLRVLRLHGSKPKYHHSLVGINSRLDALQAAILKVKLKYLDEWSDARRQRALYYNELFEGAGLVPSESSQAHLNGDGKYKIVLPNEIEGNPENGGRHIYHQYVIRSGSRDRIIAALDAHNIGHSIYYPVPLHEQECFKYLGYAPSDCVISSDFSKTTLALPIYPEITDEQQEYVVDTIKNCLVS